MSVDPAKQEALLILHTSLVEAVRSRRAALDVLLPNETDRVAATTMALTISLGHYLIATSPGGEQGYRRRVDQMAEFLHNSFESFRDAARNQWPDYE